MSVTKLLNLKGQGDLLADAAFADYQHLGADGRACFKQAMTRGNASVTGLPASCRALLQDCEAALASMPVADREVAFEPYMWIGPMWLSISLGPGSLAHTYADPAIAAVLMRTGNLVGQAAARRLLETQLWKISVIKPQGLSLGGLGYIHTLQVRLLHARVRSHLSKQGWADPNGRTAMPIDQWQLLRTWLDFTVVPFDALRQVGLALDDAQLARLYAAWRVMGRLLGVDTAALDLVADHETAREIVKFVDGELSPPDDNTQLLVKAMLESLGNRVAPALGMPVDVSILLMQSLCRLFHGEQMAQQLGIEPNWTSALIPIMADANRYRFGRIATDSVFRETVRHQSLSAFTAIEAGLVEPTAFQQI